MSTPGQGSIFGSPIIYGAVDYGPTFGRVYRPLTQVSIFTGTGNYTVQPFDQFISIKKVIGEATSVILPDLGLWMRQPYGGFPLTVKDGKGDAGANPITLVPFGAQTIDGLAQFQIAGNGGSLLLVPLADMSGWNTL